MVFKCWLGNVELLGVNGFIFFLTNCMVPVGETWMNSTGGVNFNVVACVCNCCVYTLLCVKLVIYLSFLVPKYSWEAFVDGDGELNWGARMAKEVEACFSPSVVGTYYICEVGCVAIISSRLAYKIVWDHI